MSGRAFLVRGFFNNIIDILTKIVALINEGAEATNYAAEITASVCNGHFSDNTYLQNPTCICC